MLQKLSYFNLILAIAYLLIYLKTGTLNSSAGIFFIIVFSWLSLRSYQLNSYKWGIFHYLAGVWCLYFTGTLCYGAIHISISALEVEYISNDTIFFLVMSLGLSVMVGTMLILFWIKNYKENNS